MAFILWLTESTGRNFDRTSATTRIHRLDHQRKCKSTTESNHPKNVKTIRLSSRHAKIGNGNRAKTGRINR